MADAQQNPLSRQQRQAQTAHLLHRAADEKDPRREETLGKVIVLNMPVASSVAHRYSGRGVPDADLEQVAFLALVRAVHGFDPGRGDLLSYAVPTIRGELRKHFRDHGWMVRPPRHVQEIQIRVLDAREALAEEESQPVSIAAIAERVGEDQDAVTEALQAQGCFHPTSLDLLIDPGEPTSPSLLTSHGELDAGYDAVDLRLLLAEALEVLSERDRRIVFMRFFEEMTQQEIGAAIGVTQMQVSRLLHRILEDLRTLLHAEAA